MGSGGDNPRTAWRLLIRTVVLSPVVYLLTSYLYWAVLKVVGVLMVGSFHYEDEISLVHGGAPLWLVVVFSPLTFPFHLMESISCQPTVAFITEFRYGWRAPPHALLIVLLSATISFVLAAAIIWAAIKAFRLIGGVLGKVK